MTRLGNPLAWKLFCCLIQSFFELGIEASFWGQDEAEAEGATVAEVETEDEMMEALAWV